MQINEVHFLWGRENKIFLEGVFSHYKPSEWHQWRYIWKISRNWFTQLSMHTVFKFCERVKRSEGAESTNTASELLYMVTKWKKNKQHNSFIINLSNMMIAWKSIVLLERNLIKTCTGTTLLGPTLFHDGIYICVLS